ncbi:MAG: hypothetical protein OXD36_09510 [Rhodobacter sp.]|nr:hypothetical protein [Rhodobacter sp.]
MIGWLRHNLSCQGFDRLVLVAAVTLAANLTLLVAWLLWGMC